MVRLVDRDRPVPEFTLDGGNRAAGAFDIQLEAWIETARMRERRLSPARLSRTSYRHAFWTVAHHSVNGCNLQPLPALH
jgi:fumarylacetoacetase